MLTEFTHPDLGHLSLSLPHDKPPKLLGSLQPPTPELAGVTGPTILRQALTELAGT